MIRDPISGESSLRAPSRAERPNEYADGEQERCAFCPGNEELTPPEIARTPSSGSWSVRVFANKYPAIEAPDGFHEVIVETPGHSPEMTAEGLRMWRERYRAALERMPAAFPVLFKNSGALAGATLVHPHAQLVVLPQRPQRWSTMETAARAYRAAHDRCIWCDEADRSANLGHMVEASDGLRAYVRDESRFALALTILPRECRPSPLTAGDDAWEAVANLLERIGRGLGREPGRAVAFNVLLVGDPHATDVHWHVEVAVRLGLMAGFELSTGAFIREGEAKESAERWRRIVGSAHGSI